MRPFNDEPLNTQDRLDLVVAGLVLVGGAIICIRAPDSGLVLFGFVAFFASMIFLAGWLGTPEDRLIDPKTVRLRRLKRGLRLGTYGVFAGFLVLGSWAEKCSGLFGGGTSGG